MAWETDIAQGVADTIDAASFSPAITTSRVTLDARKREDIDDDVTATVYPLEQSVGLGSRSQFMRDLTIGVVLQARVADKANATIDPLLLSPQPEGNLNLIRPSRCAPETASLPYYVSLAS